MQGILDAQRARTGARTYDVFFPGARSRTPICIRESGGFYYPDAHYWNQYTGELVGIDEYSNLPVAQRIRTSIMPLHRGVFWGSTTRYLFLIFCAIGVLLAVTGYLLTLKRWDFEEKAQQKAREREKSAEAEPRENE